MSGSPTLRRQVLAWVSIPLGILWIISAYIDYDIAKRYVNVAYDRALLESALDIGRQVRVLRGRIYVDLPEVAIQMLRTRETGQLYYMVTGPDHEFITGEPDIKPAQPSESGQAHYYDDIYRGQAVRVAAIQLPVEAEDIRGQVTVHVVENQSPRTELIRELSIGFALPQALIAICAFFVIWYSVTRALAPLSLLRQEIEQRSHRDLSPLPAANVPSEVRPLIDSMNALLHRLSAALSSQQRFIADAAHQLRTPIAGLRTQTELALRLSAPEEVRASLTQLQTAAEHTTHLVNQLLSLARAEPSAEHAQVMENLDAVALARTTTTEWVPRALARGIDLGFDGPDSTARVNGNDFLLREMLGNLIDNAINYTQRGGHVTVRLTPARDAVKIEVEDNGPGIPESERDAVLERFHRVLGTGVEGCGLGLAIVREIVLRHGGHIRLLAGPRNQGTLAQVTLPAFA
ncbi:MAG TPA: sensor histidine kinase N-terminal domain-containing protein [Burkholderiales bacterium]|nr:sensor histidine kinase N-terminal domain-containing protein [Burkholderiales bacterium]